VENEQKIYRHDHGDGVVHTHELEPEHMHAHEHTHSHEEAHTHHHDHVQTKAVINRLARAIGHLESVKRMVEEGRDCTEVLVQLAAVRSALNNTAKIILKDHIEHCISGAEGDSQALEELNAAIDKFI
jgi:DNA-binding FrmR family transcriptional regulator